ncbi:stage V sporulation protein AE [Salsuginibacillus kocurii]|uniref:stage V sporulation protein AE n=1 Tax=Salsuginibacillus kocurii TaxID=427078 RepID=UPI0023E4526C|nr:stage V sporulation protein AE [Salsuginibacillus kocurii]
MFVTDGDSKAIQAVKNAARHLQLGVVVSSPPLAKMTGQINRQPFSRVVVLFDDYGSHEIGVGEELMQQLSEDPRYEIIGALAVASTAHQYDWTHVDVSIDRFGEITQYGVDKEGWTELEVQRIKGDTTSVLDQLSIPLIVGIGDLGKMGRRDDPVFGSEITLKALQFVLEREGIRSEQSGR